MKEEFVNYNQALALKELGFNEDCLAYFNSKGALSTHSDEYEVYLINNDKWISSACSAPIKQQVFRWFRDKYGIFVSIVPYKYGSLDSFIGWIYIPSNGSTKDIDVGGRKGFKTPEETESVCIDKLIEILKDK